MYRRCYGNILNVDGDKLPFNILKDLEYKELEIGKKLFLRPLVINELSDEMNLA
jgi:hypothetical protein